MNRVTRQMKASLKTVPLEIIRLAANCGISAMGMTVVELKAEVAKQNVGKIYVDQHDMRLEEALRRLA